MQKKPNYELDLVPEPPEYKQGVFPCSECDNFRNIPGYDSNCHYPGQCNAYLQFEKWENTQSKQF